MVALNAGSEFIAVVVVNRGGNISTSVVVIYLKTVGIPGHQHVSVVETR